MRKTSALIFTLAFAALFVYHRAFLNFFTQDDFILITQFSGHGLLIDLWNAFGPPHVTHWRPLHNLYFLIGGELFGRDIFWYHLMLFSIQIAAGMFIFKSLKALNLNAKSALIAAVLYTSHPAQFISYYWISGGATAIGFCFFIISFYLYVSGRSKLSLFLFLASLLASEAMIVGMPIFIIYDYLFKDKGINLRYVARLVTISVLFLVVKLILTPRNTFNIYKFEFSWSVFSAIKYYTLRTLGFAGVAQDQLLTFLLLAWILIILFLFVNNSKNRNDWLQSLFFFLTAALGLFPFVLIPSHLAPNYMNISIFAFSGFVGLVLSKAKKNVAVLMMIGFLVISFLSVKLIEKDSWVTARSNLALKYILEIERSDLPSGSTLIFNDNYISSSYDAYIALGTGDAINFWFKGRNYKTCFSAFENCNRLH